MLQGEKKQAWMRAYMREYMRQRRAVKTCVKTHVKTQALIVKTPVKTCVKTQPVPASSDVQADTAQVSPDVLHAEIGDILTGKTQKAIEPEPNQPPIWRPGQRYPAGSMVRKVNSRGGFDVVPVPAVDGSGEEIPSVW